MNGSKMLIFEESVLISFFFWFRFSHVIISEKAQDPAIEPAGSCARDLKVIPYSLSDPQKFQTRAPSESKAYRRRRSSSLCPF